MEIFNIITLALSGLLLTFVGLMRLTNPIKTYSKNSGINIQNDTDLLNEVRGLSAVMLVSGIIILLGILFSQLSTISHSIAILIFLGFAIGRSLSTLLDGKPNKQIVQGLIFELVFGSMNLICLFNTMA